ncbi:3-deoxy-7-phosphoheptulonate synthase [candidate division LCP-89 bacterium B3_LCP]|uniref:3-deoxy-7-phosphoheptulonate synthase n=1 Tax=candidate division LCP-89 bacterium B3_LCP TaxID=2012998 RepID=A0A532V300_UNCL8|nr:MAG: 3-deoxy-7-phosphoheptulonate synthase [candidate division LCP-89 bacterium B3_LCP]
MATIQIGDLVIGGRKKLMIAGPCSIEGRDQLLDIAREVKAQGAQMLRGGAYKPRTSPHSFQGLGPQGLFHLKEASEETGLLTVTEVMEPEELDLICKYADVLQVGARNMFNYPLLKRIGRTDKPVLLKRSFMATVEEFLLASEYILKEGNKRVMLCERGIRTFDQITRNTLDLASVPILKKMSSLPVIVDPSHGTGRSDILIPMTLAALVAGADGIMIEVHPNPKKALSDGLQTLDFPHFRELMAEYRSLCKYIEDQESRRTGQSFSGAAS